MFPSRHLAYAKFSAVRVPFEQYPHCLHGGLEGLTVKLGLSQTEPEKLTAVELFYPSANDGHRAAYQAAVDTFWAVVLPGVPRAQTLELRNNAFHPARAYEQTFGDVRVTLSEEGGQVWLGAYPA